MLLTQEQISRYHEDGFLIVPNIFDAEEFAPLLLACEENPELWAAETAYKYSNGHDNRVMFYAQLSNSLLGVLPRIARVVDSVEALLGEECYHFHSKLVRDDFFQAENYKSAGAGMVLRGFETAQ